MKLVYLHQYFNTPDMPGSTRSFEMAKRIAARGHQVHVVTSDRQESSPRGWRVEEMNGFSVHWVGVPYGNEMSYTQRIASFIKFAFLASVRCVKIRGDLIFATSTPLTIAIPAIITKFWTRKPMVFEVRDLWPDLPIAMGALKSPITIMLARWLEKLAYKNATQVVGCSAGMCEGVIRHGIPVDRVHNIPNSCDIQLFRIPESRGERFREQHVWLRDRPLVVYAGTFGRINGVEYLVQVAKFALEIAPEVAFLVVGYGYDENKIDALSKELRVRDKNFYMLPKQPKSKIPEIYSAANLVTSLFLPIEEMWANSANKYFDGLAAGKPVAINYGGWQADLIEKKQIGVVLDSYDHETAARDIVQLVQNRHLLDQMSSNSLALAKTSFSRDKLAAQLIRVLEESIT